MSAVTFKPLSETERKKFKDALLSNAEGNKAIYNDRETSLLGYEGDGVVKDEEVISAIRSVPCHY